METDKKIARLLDGVHYQGEGESMGTPLLDKTSKTKHYAKPHHKAKHKNTHNGEQDRAGLSSSMPQAIVVNETGSTTRIMIRTPSVPALFFSCNFRHIGYGIGYKRARI